MNHNLTDDEFLARWNIWCGFLRDGEDSNAIHNQLNNLYWSIGVYKAKNISWGQGKIDNAATAPLFFDYYLQTFAVFLVVNIRKILEEGVLINNNTTSPDRSVISLSSILKDIRFQRQEFTRRRIFLANEIVYDEEQIKIKHEAYSSEKRRNGENFFSVPRKFWAHATCYLHEQWDSLSGTTKSQRTEDDIITEERFERLGKQIIKIRKEIETFANKFILHAATPMSRLAKKGYIEETFEGPSITRLIEISLECGSMYGELCEFLSLGRMNPLPYAQFDKWEGWDPTMYADRTVLEDTWNKWDDAIKAAVGAS